MGIAWCLKGLAGVAASQGQLEHATKLLGVAEALRKANSTPLWPDERAERDRIVTAARAQLGAVVFATAWAAWQALPLEQVITHAHVEHLLK